MDDPKRRQELENSWRARVKVAEQEYHRARDQAEAALERCGCESTSAEIEALMRARARESTALDEYMRALRILHDLVVAGKPPDS